MIKDLIRTSYRTTEDVCSILDMSRMTLYRIEKRGCLKGYRVGKRKYYSNTDIESYVSSLLMQSISRTVIDSNTTT
jgi:predicted site-specific integrase-resolvase